jgi:hypothetical protein
VAENSKPIDKGTIPISVAREIVSLLSVGLYRNFARAIRELVSNAYDGKATELKIGLDFKSKPSKVIVRDNGVGMDVNDMEKRLFHIGTVTQPTEEIDKETGRKRIGQFGIGFLSTFPYCESLTVVSKKRNADTIVQVKVPTSVFFKGETFDFKDQNVPFEKYRSDLPKTHGETIITLEGIKPHIIHELERKQISRSDASVDRFEGYEKFKWNICQFAPIQYPPNRQDLIQFFGYDGRGPLRLWLDGEELFRNVPLGAEILEKGKGTFGDASVRYVIMSPMKPVQPQEARGLQIRVRDVGVGMPTDFDVVKLRGKVLGKLNHICGEIHVIEGLVPTMIDRDSLSYTENVADMQEFFRNKFTVINETLENWARDDKDIYAVLGSTPRSLEIAGRLRSVGLIHYSKERLRPPKKSVVSYKRLAQIVEARAKTTEFKIKVEKMTSPSAPPIEVVPEEKVVIIREFHPRLEERITILGKTFEADNARWKPSDSIQSAYRLSGQKVTFNIGHPVFRLDLEESSVKRLVLGIGLIVSQQSKNKTLLDEFYKLLMEVFSNEI